MMQPSGKLIEPSQQEQLFEHKYKAVIQSPAYECPCSAVPQSREHPDDKYISELYSHAALVAAERDVDVLSEPRAERHMPAAPEISYT